MPECTLVIRFAVGTPTKPFVYDNRHGISIIDLEKTYDLLEKASKAVEEVVSQGKQVLLVGTKRQAQEPIRELAAATNMPFSVNRWMGGTLTNFETVSASLAKYKKFLRMEDDGSLDTSGKEGLRRSNVSYAEKLRRIAEPPRFTRRSFRH